MPGLQDWIHKLEEGSGARYLKYGALFLTVVMLTLTYNWRVFKNMSTQEAMDSAQLARNLAEGKGYTTHFVRPFSIHLLQKSSDQPAAALTPGTAQLKGMHPDLANPPLYPLVLAGLMKILPFQHEISANESFWNLNRRFWWYQPDFLIGLFNQGLFFAAVILVYFLARRLFDTTVAWLSAVVFLGTELFWRFSTSGLSTMFLLVIFLGVVWCLVLLEQGARENTRSEKVLLGLAVLAGLLVGLGGLTRYSFGWLIIPVFLFLLLFLGQRRVALCLLTVSAFLATMGPWVVRNYHVSGTPFGTAGYAVYEHTSNFPGNRLERSLNPDFKRVTFSSFWYKFMGNTRQIISNEFPKMGGSWVTAFFLVGLLVSFHNQTINRLRYFVILCLVVLVMVQALGKTQLSEDSPEINSENLLALLVPLIFIYAVSLFLLLMDRLSFPFAPARHFVVGLFLVLAGGPLIFALLPPRSSFPIAYPPYFPPLIQQSADWMKESELMMSDIPWAVAWYGNRQCLWMTLNAQDDFFAINDYQKPIQALYLTPQTLDSRFLSEWVRGGEQSWGRFIMECFLRREVPVAFPLKKAANGFMPEQLFLADYERWIAPAPLARQTPSPPP
jgi:hypothetical protein